MIRYKVWSYRAKHIKSNIKRSSLLEAIFLPLIEEVSLRAPQVDNLRAPVPILLLLRALFAVVGVRDPNPTTNYTTALERAVITLVTYAYERARPHIRIADHAFSVALLAQAANGDARLLSAHDEVWVVLCHDLLMLIRA